MLCDTPKLEVLRLHTVYCLRVLILADRSCRLGVTRLWDPYVYPLLDELSTYILLELRNGFFDRFTHVLLLHSLQLRHAFFNELEDRIILIHRLESSGQ